LLIAVLLSAVLNVAPPVPRSFIPPKGWTQGKDLPPGGPDAVWLSPNFGINGNGENLGVSSHRIAPGTTVASEAREAIRRVGPSTLGFHCQTARRFPRCTTSALSTAAPTVACRPWQVGCEWESTIVRSLRTRPEIRLRPLSLTRSNRFASSSIEAVCGDAVPG
jgi:hypothetical protein